MRSAAILAAALVLVGPQDGAGQLAERLNEMEDGWARFAFQTQPDVEICDQGVRRGESTMHWRWSRGEDRDGTGCRFGPAEVEVRMRAGEVREIDFVHDLRDARRGAVDLGEVDPTAAVDFLLGVARTGRPDPAEDAIFPAMLADAPESWRGVLEVAKDRRIDSEVREQALFWLGQEAAEAANEGLIDVARDDDEEQEVRNAAIFALSQRPNDESVPLLMELARDADQAATRKQAMFWLAQSGDDRVVEFFEAILIGR